MPPRYIKGKFANAACVLDDILSARGIKATVGYATSRRKKELFVYCERREDMLLVPKEFEGFAVAAVHASEVRALDNQPPQH